MYQWMQISLEPALTKYAIDFLHKIYNQTTIKKTYSCIYYNYNGHIEMLSKY